jgi:hypothetical protein
MLVSSTISRTCHVAIEKLLSGWHVTVCVVFCHVQPFYHVRGAFPLRMSIKTSHDLFLKLGDHLNRYKEALASFTMCHWAE